MKVLNDLLHRWFPDRRETELVQLELNKGELEHILSKTPESAETRAFRETLGSQILGLKSEIAEHCKDQLAA